MRARFMLEMASQQCCMKLLWRQVLHLRWKTMYPIPKESSAGGGKMPKISGTNSYPMSSDHMKPACEHIPSFIYLFCPLFCLPACVSLVLLSSCSLSSFSFLPNTINPTLLRNITHIVSFMYLTTQVSILKFWNILYYLAISCPPSRYHPSTEEIYGMQVVLWKSGSSILAQVRANFRVRKREMQAKWSNYIDPI